MKRTNNAFTMIELVLVIVVLGILASLALPRLDQSYRQQAADNILNAIRFTQHLALVDNKTIPTQNDWQMTLWKISFTTGASPFYTVSTDIDKDGSVDKNETAVNPANGLYMYNTGGATVQQDKDEDPNIFLGKKYGINNISFSGGCANSQHIAFDHLGRPHVNIGGATNDYHTLMTDDCDITFKFSNNEDDLVITIQKQTGFAFIENQPAS